MLLIISACIAPNENCPNLVLKNPESRFEQYYQALIRFMKFSSFSDILLCDNSNFKFDFKELYSIAYEEKKRFEYLTFQGDETKIHKAGKGVGEVEIMQYAFQNSSLIKENDYFFKITGRLYIENIECILEHIKLNNNYFNLNFPCWDKQLDTRFYSMKKEDFEKYFLNHCYDISDEEGQHLENVFYKVFKDNKRNISYKCMPTYPGIIGISGSSGLDYEALYKKSRNIYSLLAKFGILNLSIMHRLIRSIKLVLKRLLHKNQ